MESDSVRIGEDIEVTIDRIAYGGDAVGRYNGLVVFVSYGAPGDRLRLRVTERKRNYIRATIEEVIVPSSSRQEPPCRYFGDCGGCQLQHLDYNSQLEAKQGFIGDSLSRIGHIDWSEPIEIEHERSFGYRSKARLQIDRKGRRVGFKRAAGSAVCDVEECPVFVDELNEALQSLRQLVKFGSEEPLVSEVDVAAGDADVSFEPGFGGLPSGEIKRTVGAKVYRLQPGSFFQGNALLLERLIGEVVSEERGGLALDLYCGVGLFTVPLADGFSKVIGVEANPVSAAAARRNLEANGVQNAKIVSSRVGGLRETDEDRPDLVVLDPPREGASEALPLLLRLKPPRVTYVSCDPVTLSRDLRALVDGGFEVRSVKGFDLFPQTYHVETVVRLKWRGQ